MKIVTFNIRCSWDTFDANNAGLNRAGQILTKIDSEKPDVVCFQETMEPHKSFLQRYLTDYTVIYNGRLENYDGEGLSIALRKESTELLRHDFFWLSDTPFVPASMYEAKEGYPRICQVTTLLINKKPIIIYNTHLDCYTEDIRVLQIKQILKRISEDKIALDCPQILLGDFNSQPTCDTIKTVLNSCFVDLTSEQSITYHGFQGEKPQKIDYIFADKELAKSVMNVSQWTDSVCGTYLSDHYPCIAEIEL